MLIKNALTMTAIEQEQYAFGPWLTEITDEMTLPHQYKMYAKPILDAKFAFKIPVNIDRKDTEVGMLLYQEVVTLSHEGLVVYHYDEMAIQVTEIPFHQIRYMIMGGELLYSYMTIGFLEEELTLRYYSVSNDITQRFTEMVKAGMDLDSFDHYVPVTYDDIAYHGSLYNYFVNAKHSDSCLSLIAHQPEMAVEAKVHPIGETLFLSNGRELVVVSGDTNQHVLASADYSYRHTYMKLDTITGITEVTDLRYHEMKHLMIHMDTLTLSFEVSVDFYKEGICSVVTNVVC